MPSISSPSIKVAFFDIDGTLVGPSGTYSEAVKSEIHRVQSLGVVTAIASGRPPFACTALIDDLGLSGLGLFHAGAVLYDPRKAFYLEALTLAGESQGRFLQAVQSAQVYCEVYLQDGYAVAAPGEIQAAHSHCLGVEPRFMPLEEAIEQGPVFKFLVGVNGEERLHVLKELEVAFPEFQFAYAKMASHPHWNFASVIHGGVDKAAAFERLCQAHGVRASEVIAFGDAAADKVFLQCAGIGVAMGNGTDEVKACADFVTASVTEDGVAAALAQFIPGSP